MLPIKAKNLLFLLFLSTLTVKAERLTGTWNSAEFFHFLTKFVFQKTDVHDPYSSGYIYGNITSRSEDKNTVLLAVMEKEYFDEYYNNRLIDDKNDACNTMLRKFNNTFCNITENNEISSQLLLEIPCKADQICYSNISYLSFVEGSQFSFEVKDFHNPRLYYASFISCYYDVESCQFFHSCQDITIFYDLWFVNENPNKTTHNPLVHHFSYEKQDVMQLHMLFFSIEAMLVPVQCYAVSRQDHPITKLFTVSLSMEFVSITLNLCNILKFAINGSNMEYLTVVGDILNISARMTFMLSLLLLAKGWAFTRNQISWNCYDCFAWILYVSANYVLYFWNREEIDVVTNVEAYHTYTGLITLSLRVVVIIWFLSALRITMLYESNVRKHDFFLHFGAATLVWLVYLPVSAIVALEVSPLWRHKFLYGVSYAADCLAYCVMTHLLWPTRSEQYILLAASVDNTDELDVFNEAPHNLNNYKPPEDEQ